MHDFGIVKTTKSILKYYSDFKKEFLNYADEGEIIITYIIDKLNQIKQQTVG